MNCRTAVELLPWLLNGTLDEEERREVLEHLKGCDDCRRELAETREAAMVYRAHPEADQLRALLRDELAPEREELVQAHLASCSACREDLALLRESWQGLDDAVEAMPATGGDAPTEAGVLVGPWGARGWRRLALAASLVAALLAATWIWVILGARPDTMADHAGSSLGAELETQRRQIQELERRLAELSRSAPRGEGRGGAAETLGADGEETGEATELERVRGELRQARQDIQELERRREDTAVAQVSVPLPLYAEQSEAILRGDGGDQAQGLQSLPTLRRSRSGAQALQLLTTQSPATSTVLLELIDPEGAVAQRSLLEPGAAGAAGGELIVMLEPARMAAGTWRIRLLAADSEEEIALFGFQIIE